MSGCILIKKMRTDLCLVLLSILSFNGIHPNQSKHHSFPEEYAKQKGPVRLYLSFDDGIADSSQALCRIADSCQIPVNVFLVGKFVLKSDSTKQVWKAMQASPWIEMGNHSFSHADKKYHQYYGRPMDVLADFSKNQDSIGFTNKLARLPGRNVWRIGNRSRNDLEDSNAIADTLAGSGYQLIGWDLEWNYSGTDLSLEHEDDLIFRIQQAIRNNKTFTPQHLVILCHDPALQNPMSQARLLAFIQKIRQDGKYAFSFLSKYPGMP